MTDNTTPRVRLVKAVVQLYFNYDDGENRVVHAVPAGREQRNAPAHVPYRTHDLREGKALLAVSKEDVGDVRVCARRQGAVEELLVLAHQGARVVGVASKPLGPSNP